jgi:hypothetical protein
MIRKNKLVPGALLAVLILAACTGGSPQIDVETEQVDLGEVTNGEIVEWDMLLSNTGNAPLEIQSVSASCGCTTATVDRTLILPGEEAILHVRFDSGAHGPDLVGEFSRQIFIASNDADRPEIRIDFTANLVIGAAQ